MDWVELEDEEELEEDSEEAEDSSEVCEAEDSLEAEGSEDVLCELSDFEPPDAAVMPQLARARIDRALKTHTRGL